MPMNFDLTLLIRTHPKVGIFLLVSTYSPVAANRLYYTTGP